MSASSIYDEINSFPSGQFIPQRLPLCLSETSIAGEGTDFKKAVKIMDWISCHTFYSGMSTNCPADNGLSILDKSFDKGFEFALNCRFRAIVFSDCLVALGIRAIPLALISEKDKLTGGFGCHLVVHMFDIENNKWYLFDPSFNTYFTNADGDKLDVYSLRECFLCDEKVILNGYSFNGENRCSDVYIEHFIKQCLTNIYTWKDNSMLGRNYGGKNFNFRKKFDCKLPK